MSSNADKVQSLINATPYKWPTQEIGKALGMSTNAAHRACVTLEKYGLVKHHVTYVNRRCQALWYRVGRA